MEKNENAAVSMSERLKYVMAKRKLSITELSRLANVPFSSLSGYVSGKYVPKLETVCKLASAMGVSIAWMAGELPLEDIDTPVNISMKEEQEKAFLKYFSSLDYGQQAILFNSIKGLVYSDNVSTGL